MDRDYFHQWAASQVRSFPPPWLTCDAVLAETFYMLGPDGGPSLTALLRRTGLRIAFALRGNLDAVLDLMEKYSDVPMSLADACLVRMTEILEDPIILTTDQDFRVYRRHSRQIVPCVLPD
jgi:predicted nucleic acid-binding protein